MQLLQLLYKDCERTKILPGFSVRTGMHWFAWSQTVEGDTGEVIKRCCESMCLCKKVGEISSLNIQHLLNNWKSNLREIQRKQPQT